MYDFVLGVLMLGAFAWLFSQWGKVRPQVEEKGRDHDPLTGAIYGAFPNQAQDGLKDKN